jgi:hypothetical protein
VTINTGGSAFPVIGWKREDGLQVVAPECGMTLRQWYAGLAIPWCLAEFAGNAEDMKQPVEAAFQIADALIAHEEAEAKKLEGEPA